MRSYTAAQIAAACGVCVQTVHRAMRSGKLASRTPRGLTKPQHSTLPEIEEWFGGPTIFDIDGFDARGHEKSRAKGAA